MACVNVADLARLGCRHFYRADVWFSHEMLFGGNETLLRSSREEGMETSIDINWDPLWNRGNADAEVMQRRDAIMGILHLVSYVHGNERELMFFTGTATVQEAAHALVERGAGAVIVHRGSKGCAALSQGRWIDVPASPVSRIVSETGTGDVFTAGFLLNSDMKIEERLQESCPARSRTPAGRALLYPRLGGQ